MAGTNDVSSEATIPPRPRGSEITIQSILAGMIVAGIMGLSYPYMVLKLGFGPNVSIVSAFFGFVILSVIARKSYDRWQNNIVQTAGTSAAQTAFMCIMLASFDMLRESKIVEFDLEPTPMQTFTWLSVAALLGTLLAVPLRKHFVVDENLPYPDGTAAAETLKVLDPPRDVGKDDIKWIQARRAAIVLGIGLVLSGALMLFREDAQIFKIIPEGWNPGDMTLGVAGASVVVAAMGVGFSYSLLSIGSGIIIGLRISFWMLVGGALGWIVAPYVLVQEGILPDHPTRTQVLYWIMWPAIALVMAGGMTILVARWRSLAEAFRAVGSAGTASNEFPMSLVIIGVVGLSATLCYLQTLYFGIPIWMTLVMIVTSLPLMLVGLRALGETNWGPISSLSNLMQGLFAAIAPGNINANILANGTTGTIASTSEALMQDYRAGHLIGSTPRAMTYAQLMGAPIGAAALAWSYPLLVSTYGITGDNAQLAAPTARRAAGFAEVLSGGVDQLPATALIAAGIAIVLGIIFALMELNKGLRVFTPSPTALSIGALIPFAANAPILVGAIFAALWMLVSRRTANVYMIPLASGFIAGEALIAILVPVILWVQTLG
ncbi:MAG: OPT/YSL family transporter [Alphaproteobacteria bacterium]|nr:OPT/YSL family transporter [Alphaproteobacteria bacterium]